MQCLPPQYRMSFSLVVALGILTPGLKAPGEVKPETIAEITGFNVTHLAADGVYKIAVPRTDVAVRVDGLAFDPFRGLTSWAGFQDGKRAEAMIMGDIVLFQDEVNAAMSAALDNGLTVTALHNHFFYDEPKVYFMHIGGEGSTAQLATGIRELFAAIRLIRKQRPAPATSFGHEPQPSGSSITVDPIIEILGAPAAVKDGMAKFVFGRTATMDCGCQVGAAMGMNTWVVFSGHDDEATVDGDFACLPGELQPTLKALRARGINIVAIHNHMEQEDPRTFFLHYWGTGSATELAKSLKAAMDVGAKSSRERRSKDGDRAGVQH